MKKIILILFAAVVLLASVYADVPISNPIPSNNSVLPSGTTSTTLSIETNINATCKYWNTSGQDFSSMTLFTNTDKMNHNSTITGLQDAQGYDYYIKCQNADNTSDITDDYQIHFFILDYALEYCFTDQLGYWTFDNFIDNIIYDILGINYGTIYGDVTTDPSVVGDGFNFNGVDSYIDVDGDIDLANSTISFWITPDQDYGLDSGQTKNITLFKDDYTEIVINPDGEVKKLDENKTVIISSHFPRKFKKDEPIILKIPTLLDPDRIILGNKDCLILEPLKFIELTPKEISPDSFEYLAVLNGCPPFNWTVAGEGFSLDEGIAGEMTLSANEFACGAAEITVTDDMGQIVTTTINVKSSGNGTFYPTAVTDTGYWFSGVLTCATSAIYFGHPGISINSFARFADINIPQGSTITSATIRWDAESTQSSTDVLTNVYFNDEDNAVAPTIDSAADALNLTDAIAWDHLSPTTEETQYDSCELKTILQTVVDRDGWESGNAIMFIVKDDGSTANNWRDAISYYYAADGIGQEPELHVTWE